MFRERFTSKVTLNPDDRRIHVAYVDGPFKYLDNHWVFLEHDEGCLIDFYVDFEFRSRLLQRVIQPLFDEAVRRMVRAFESRADDLYEPVTRG
jgi:coenzyme Q-binding protein COQ10